MDFYNVSETRDLIAAAIGQSDPTECISKLQKFRSGIYAIFCEANGKYYIGQTKYIERRISNHKSDLKCNRHRNCLLQSAYYKYGKDSFKYLVLEICGIDELDDRERYYIAKFNSLEAGYNLESGGNANKVISDSAKLKMSLAKKGMPGPNIGKKASPELRKKLSEAHKGLPSPKKGKPATKPVWNKGLKGVQDNGCKKKVYGWNKYTNQQYGEFDSIEAYKKSVGTKSKNWVRTSGAEMSIGQYAFRYL